MTTPVSDTLRHRLIALLRARSIERGNFVLASGRRATYYIDARRTTMSAEGLEVVGQLGLARLRERRWHPQAVGGLTLGADPVAYALALASLRNPPVLDAFSVRQTPKTHGTAKLIEGCFPEGGNVVVVEDVITTGASALRAVQAVRAAGAQVLGVLAVVDRGEGGREALEAEGLAVLTLVSLDDLGL